MDPKEATVVMSRVMLDACSDSISRCVDDVLSIISISRDKGSVNLQSEYRPSLILGLFVGAICMVEAAEKLTEKLAERVRRRTRERLPEGKS